MSATPPDVVTGNRLRAGSLGPITLAVFVVSAVGPVAALIGASPFIFMAMGPGAVTAYIIAVSVFLLLSVGYVSMAKRLPHAGGFVNFIATAFDRRLGAGAAMLVIVAYVSLLAAIYAVFAVFVQQALLEYLGLEVHWGVVLVVSAIVVVLVAINRVDINAKIIAAILLAEIALLLVLVVCVLAQGGAQGITLEPFAPRFFIAGDVAVGLLWALGSFLGFEATAVFSEEARTPKKTVPRATFLAVGFMGAFFILLTWTISLGYGTDAVQDAALADPVGFIYALGDQYVGGIWSAVMSFMVLVSFSLILIGFHNIVCRYVFALGRAGFLAHALGRTHRRTQAPHMASIAIGAACLVILAILGLTGADPYGEIYPWLFALGAVGVYLILFSVCVAVPVFFARRVSDGRVFPAFVAPIASAALIAAALVLILTNYEQLTGPGAPLLVLWSPVLLPIVAVIGYLIGRGKTEKQLDFTVSSLDSPSEDWPPAEAD